MNEAKCAVAQLHLSERAVGILTFVRATKGTSSNIDGKLFGFSPECAEAQKDEAPESLEAMLDKAARGLEELAKRLESICSRL
jgi:hypothetical protein